MNYYDITSLFKNKFKDYTISQISYAIRDCHETLALNVDNKEYCVKLWAEIDALRDRDNILKKRSKLIGK